MAIERQQGLAYEICDTGLSVVSEPGAGNVVADIVFIHGLQGHPYRTWLSTKGVGSSSSSSSSSNNSIANNSADSKAGNRLKRAASSSISDLRIWPKRAKAGTVPTFGDDEGLTLGDILDLDPDGYPPHSTSGPTVLGSAPVYWPGDLLPSECPRARILAWGYDTVVTKKFSAPANKNNLLSHAKDLLFALSRERPLDRPIVFVAHSLGGIITKEMLANSAISEDHAVRNISQKTAAVVFLGTPHRGSEQMANLGEIVRKVASSVLKMDTNPAALDALGLKTSDLERCQESFSRLWRASNFTVKTFQEGLGLTSVNIGSLSNKVVPDYSSVLGDPRERAETLQANHREMCRFSGEQDPNYRKVAGELREIYKTIIQRENHDLHVQPRAGVQLVEPQAQADSPSNYRNIVDLLKFPKMNRRLRTIHEPARLTCQWLFRHRTFTTWRRRLDIDQHHGLLWIRGKPGSGKSTLMREVYRDLSKKRAEATCCIFFFNAKGGRLDRTPMGLYRSLLYQLVFPLEKRQTVLAASLEELRLQRIVEGEEIDASEFPFSESEVRKLLMEAIHSLAGEKVIMLIDALDECDSSSIRDVAYFLRDITDLAYESRVRLDICFSSRHYPLVSLRGCLEICVEEFNGDDIALYTHQKLSMARLRVDPHKDDTELLRKAILGKASGVFLWVVLVVDRLLREHDEGANVKQLISRSKGIPSVLGELFTDLLSKNQEDAETTVRFFQWAILGPPTLRVREWRHVLGFVRLGSFGSLEEWKESRWYPESDEHLEKQIHNISRGLVEVVGGRLTAPVLQAEGQADDDGDSIGAGAGSLVQEGENRIVQVVHQSVRDFFLSENGFQTLHSSLTENAVGLGHVAIIHNCFDYMCLKELDCLVAAREKVRELASSVRDEPATAVCRPPFNQPSPRPCSRPPSVASFGSAGSPCYSPPPYFPSPTSPCLLEPSLPDDAFVLDELNERYNDPDECEQYRLSLMIGRGDGAGADGSFDSTMGSDGVEAIAQQLLDSELPASRLWRRRSTRSNKTSSSVAASAVLEADLPLLDYSTTMPIAHARHAELAGADQRGVVLRLQDGKIWRRWRFLREDIHPSYGMLEYLTAKNVKCWVDSIQASLFNDDPCMAFLKAVREGHRDTILAFVRRDVDKPCYPSQGSLLHRLINEQMIGGALEYLGGLEWLQREERLDPSSLSVNAVDALGQTPLELATKNMIFETWTNDLRLRLPEKLLQIGADVNAKDSSDRRLLDRLCCSRHPPLNLIKLLLSYDADLGPPGPDQMTPLQQICLHSEDSEVAGLLLKAGASPDPEGTGGRKPLSICCDASHPNRQMIAMLIKYGASVHSQDGFGQTVLHIVCSRPEPNPGLINLLLKGASMINTQDSQGRTPLHVACLKNDRRIVPVVWHLVGHDKSMINLRDNQGETPLHLALRCSHPNVARALLIHGARVDVADRSGKTPVSAALARLEANGDFDNLEIVRSVIRAAERQGFTSFELELLRQRLDQEHLD